jgi:DNA repair photolyase
MQGSLFDTEENKKNRIGQSSIHYKNASSILTPASGFMEAYDYTLNPYSGCSFGCTYCYAAFFARDNELKEKWGYWVNVKENALSLLAKWRRKSLDDKTIYISSVTDPYQPIEKELQLTRSILTELANYHKPRIVIQTRSPLIVRDIDVLKQFETVQVNMTITTDNEPVRKAFEPYCPSNQTRLEAIKEVNKAGISTCITMTPLLPIEDAEKFAKSLLSTGVSKFIIQPFHAEKGKYIAGTRENAVRIIEELGWNHEKYEAAFHIIKRYIPNIGVGKQGFAPV